MTPIDSYMLIKDVQSHPRRQRSPFPSPEGLPPRRGCNEMDHTPQTDRTQRQEAYQWANHTIAAGRDCDESGMCPLALQDGKNHKANSEGTTGDRECDRPAHCQCVEDQRSAGWILVGGRSSVAGDTGMDYGQLMIVEVSIGVRRSLKLRSDFVSC